MSLLLVSAAAAVAADLKTDVDLVAGAPFDVTSPLGSVFGGQTGSVSVRLSFNGGNQPSSAQVSVLSNPSFVTSVTSATVTPSTPGTSIVSWTAPCAIGPFGDATSNGAVPTSVTYKVDSQVGGNPLGTTGALVNIGGTVTDITACSGPSNSDPVADAGGPYTGTEGTGIPMDGTVSSDPDNDVLAYAWTVDDSGITSAGSCIFDDATSATPELTCDDNGTATVTLDVDDGNGGTDSDTASVTVGNADPVVDTPTWLDANIDCGDGATLQNISFSDDGTNDTWDLSIDWDDGSSFYGALGLTTQGLKGDQSHTYDDPGTYNATVGVTDDDGGTDSAASGDLVVAQTYSNSFLQPIENLQMTGKKNTFKNGRVIPVKVVITDDCTGEAVTGTSGEVVTIALNKTALNVGGADAVESFADPGASNGNTDEFRWSADGFWIYNLDSKALGMESGSLYELKVLVDDIQTSITAILQPTR
jgi:hypothetical protein